MQAHTIVIFLGGAMHHSVLVPASGCHLSHTSYDSSKKCCTLSHDIYSRIVCKYKAQTLSRENNTKLLDFMLHISKK
jgi:hypothetical protein